MHASAQPPLISTRVPVHACAPTHTHTCTSTRVNVQRTRPHCRAVTPVRVTTHPHGLAGTHAHALPHARVLVETLTRVYPRNKCARARADAMQYASRTRTHARTHTHTHARRPTSIRIRTRTHAHTQGGRDSHVSHPRRQSGCPQAYARACAHACVHGRARRVRAHRHTRRTPACPLQLRTRGACQAPTRMGLGCPPAGVHTDVCVRAGEHAVDARTGGACLPACCSRARARCTSAAHTRSAGARTHKHTCAVGARHRCARGRAQMGAPRRRLVRRRATLLVWARRRMSQSARVCWRPTGPRVCGRVRPVRGWA